MLDPSWGGSVTLQFLQFPLPHLPPAHVSTSLPKRSGLQVRVAFWKNLGKDLGRRGFRKGFDRNLNLAIHYRRDFSEAQSPSSHLRYPGTEPRPSPLQAGWDPPSEKPRTDFR